MFPGDPVQILQCLQIQSILIDLGMKTEPFMQAADCAHERGLADMQAIATLPRYELDHYQGVGQKRI